MFCKWDAFRYKLQTVLKRRRKRLTFVRDVHSNDRNNVPFTCSKVWIRCVVILEIDSVKVVLPCSNSLAERQLSKKLRLLALSVRQSAAIPNARQVSQVLCMNHEIRLQARRWITIVLIAYSMTITSPLRSILHHWQECTRQMDGRACFAVDIENSVPLEQ